MNKKHRSAAASGPAVQDSRAGNAPMAPSNAQMQERLQHSDPNAPAPVDYETMGYVELGALSSDELAVAYNELPTWKFEQRGTIQRILVRRHGWDTFQALVARAAERPSEQPNGSTEDLDPAARREADIETYASQGGWVDWNSLGYSSLSATLAKRVAQMDGAADDEERRRHRREVLMGLKSLRNNHHIEGTDEDLTEVIRRGKLPISYGAFKVMRLQTDKEGFQAHSASLKQILVDFDRRIAETDAEVRSHIDEYDRVEAECMEVLDEFVKGVIWQKFGEVVATLPLSVVKVANVGRAATALKIAKGVGTASDMGSIGQGLFDVDRVWSARLDRVVSDLSEDAVSALGFAQGSWSMSNRLVTQLAGYRSEIYDQRIAYWDDTIPGMSYFSDKVVRAWDAAAGNEESYSDIRDDYIVKLASANADSAVQYYWYRSERAHLSEGRARLEHTFSRLTDDIDTKVESIDRKIRATDLMEYK